MRNALAPVRHAVAVVRDASASRKQHRWSLDVIERQLQRMALLLDNLLHVSRITRGALLLRRERCALQPIVTAAIEIAQSRFSERHHQLALDMPAAPLWLSTSDRETQRQRQRRGPALFSGVLLTLMLFAGCGSASAQTASATTASTQAAEALHAKHAALRDALANSPFQRPLVLESQQAGGSLSGEVYAVLAQPFSVVGPSLQALGNWCDILITHLNVKACRSGGNTLRLAVGRKFDQPVADTYELAFDYRVAASTADHLDVTLSADAGPVGTHDYRIVIEAVPLDAGSSFVHMSYAYAYGLAARLAMQAYLATVGHDKVGFSVVERQADGAPVYIGNVRGVVERNTMRYFLAIDAFLGAARLPPAERAERRITDWFAATERYARQLHELERDDYLAMKRKEIARMQAAASAPP